MPLPTQERFFSSKFNPLKQMVTFSDFFESDLHSKTGKFDFKEGDLTILTICPTCNPSDGSHDATITFR